MLEADSGEQHGQRGDYVPVTQSNAESTSVVGGRRLRQLYNGSLLLTDASAADAGFYLCHASNSVGADLSKVIRLVVHSKRFLAQSAASVAEPRFGCRGHLRDEVCGAVSAFHWGKVWREGYVPFPENFWIFWCENEVFCCIFGNIFSNWIGFWARPRMLLPWLCH